MSPRFRTYSASILFLLVSVQPHSTRACGPFFTETILDLSFAILRAPETSFDLEMARITLDSDELPGKLKVPDQIRPHYPNWKVPEGLIELMFASSGDDLIADRDGCRSKLAASQIDIARDVAEVATFLKTGEQVEEYRALRAMMMPGKNRVVELIPQPDGFRASNQIKNRDWPDFLPREFHLYLDGASDFSNQKWDAAATQFEALLALPLDERKYRSTWAAYMRARVELKKGDVDLKNSIVHFRRVLDVREDGCFDSLGLGWDALRSVADYKLLAGETAEALRYRFALAWQGAGPVSPMLDLKRWLYKRLPTDQAVELSRNDVFVRQLFTAAAINSVNVVEYWNEDAGAESNRWMEFLKSVEIDSEEAGNAAHLAYLAGDLDSTAAFLKKASAKDSIAIWLRVKLMAKAGQVRSANRELVKVEESSVFSRSLSDEIPQFISPPDFRDDITSFADYQAGQYWGERGILELANDNFVEAMEAFVKSGHWRDAAYVAEQLLSCEELLSYVRERWPTHESSLTGMQNDFGYSLRYLTARRLARERYFKDARGLFPPDLVPVFDKYVENYRVFRNRKKPESERAAAGWEAAQIHRKLGMELFGTEVGPDFTCWNGSYEDWRNLPLERLKELAESRRAKTAPHYRNPVRAEPLQADGWRKERLDRILQVEVFPNPTPSEKWRWRHYAKLPNANRFHYRHVAADLAWEASQLMPGESEETAQVLNIAGSWLQVKHPLEADVFYKAMVRRNRSTPTAHHADQIRWFVETDWHNDYNPWKSLWLPKSERTNFLKPKRD